MPNDVTPPDPDEPELGEELAGTEVVTLYGTRSKRPDGSFLDAFKDRLAPGERGRSVIRGSLTPAEASRLIRRRRKPAPGDAVRHYPVEVLNELGFRAFRAPLPQNPEHCEVLWAGDGEWDDDVAEKFRESANETIVFGDPPEVPS